MAVLFFTSCVKDAPHLIRYEVGGSGNSYQISYNDVNGDSVYEGVVTNLWRQEFAADASGTAVLWLKNRNSSGTATGTIYKDDKVAATQTVSGVDSFKIILDY